MHKEVQKVKVFGVNIQEITVYLDISKVYKSDGLGLQVVGH